MRTDENVFLPFPFQTQLLPKCHPLSLPLDHSPGSCPPGEPRDPQLTDEEPGKPDRNQTLGKEVF